MISRIYRGENENIAAKRKRQIDTLKIFNDNVVELREDVEYQVEFDAGSKRMAIMVSLSPEFPLEKPILRVSPQISHPWCNDHSEIISAPGLLNFTVHSDLGRVVQAIIREFSKNPPQLNEDLQTMSSYYTCSTTSSSINTATTTITTINSVSNSNSNDSNTCSNINQYNFVNGVMTEGCYASASSHCQNYSNSPGSNSTPLQYSPDHHKTYQMNTSFHYLSSSSSSLASSINNPTFIQFDFNELNQLSNEELIEIGEDQDKLDDFLNEHSQLKNINLTIDNTIDSVEKLANDNLTKETELKQLQDEIITKIHKVTVLKEKYDNLIHKYSKLSEVFTPDHIKNCLKNAADDSNEKSEKIAENFLEGKLDVERFLNTYIECRKLGQTRRTKEEKLAHQLDELKRAGY